MQSLWLIIVVFFFILLILPLFAKVNVSFDVLNNEGAFSVYLLFIKIISYRLRYKDNQIIVYTEQASSEIELQVSAKQLRFLKQMTVQMKEKVILKNMTFISCVGLSDAYYTALANGAINAIVYSIMACIKNTKKSAKMQVICNPKYNSSGFTLCMVVNCFVTLFDVIYALMMSLIIIKRSEKYERV